VFAHAVGDLVKVGGGLGVLRHLAGEGEGGGVAATPAGFVAPTVRRFLPLAENIGDALVMQLAFLVLRHVLSNRTS
jgi:hypothetical protein